MRGDNRDLTLVSLALNVGEEPTNGIKRIDKTPQDTT